MDEQLLLPTLRGATDDLFQSGVFDSHDKDICLKRQSFQRPAVDAYYLMACLLQSWQQVCRQSPPTYQYDFHHLFRCTFSHFNLSSF